MSLLQSFAQRFKGRGRGRPARPAKRPSPMRLEALEDRAVPAFVGGELTVKNDTAPVFLAANASSSNGMSVAVYTRENAPADNDILARLYFADGTSKEVNIATGSANDFSPSVAMDANGNFVVSWTRLINGNLDVMVRRFSNQGKAQPEGLLHVADSTANETQSDVAMDPVSGNFVVAFTRSSNSGLDVLYKQFKIVNGTPQSQGTRSVSSLSGVDESEPSVAMNSSGFAVAYTSENGGANPDVKLKRFDNNGVVVGTNTITSTPGTERNPSLAMDGLGNMVVAFEKFVGNDTFISARRVSNGGVLGDEVFVANFFNRDSTDPEVALSASGAYVVAYNLSRPDNSTAVRVTEVGADDFIRNGAEHVIETPGQRTIGAAVSIDPSGRYFVTYERDNGDDQNIFGQRGQL